MSELVRNGEALTLQRTGIIIEYDAIFPYAHGKAVGV